MKKTVWSSALVLGLLACARAQAAPPAEIRVLSSRPDMVSGEDALIAVRAHDPIQLSTVHVRLNGRDVTAAFRRGEAEDQMVGLVSGLVPGTNELDADVPDAPPARLELVDHSINGPIFSGPHLTPYECRTVEAGLGPALDSDCNAPTQVSYFYRTTGGKFLPLPHGAALPGDIATTTTKAGVSAPYVVRVETGVINRAIYRIAVLAPPPGATGQPTSFPAWNHRLVVGFGGGCGVHYNQGANDIAMVLSDVELSRGYAFMNSPALVAQQFCNPALEGETLMMLKEHFIKAYGPPVWTAGVGASGGAIQQYEIAQMYPGLLDGLQPNLSFPDYQLQPPIDGELLRAAFDRDPARWTGEKKSAVLGETDSSYADWHSTFGPTVLAVPPPNKLTSTGGGVIVSDMDPCGLKAVNSVYDAANNPRGVRCSVYDGQANLLGRGPDGRVRRPLDNVGVQYGLAALNAGKITAEDFVVLNETVGGFDGDGRLQPARSVADPIALRNAYATGLMNSGGGGLGEVPILTLRYYVDEIPAGHLAAIHDRVQDFIIRDRLARANGDADNQVIWTRSISLLGGDVLRAPALELMAAWLDAIKADPAPLTHAKVVALKPAAAKDTCWSPLLGHMVVEKASAEAGGQCNGWYPLHSQPRLVAGEPATADVMKCALKPLSAADYAVSLTPDQLARLRAVFPTGVCDYSRPGQEQVGFTGAVVGGAAPASFSP
jgi:hypothetical protein